MNLFSRSKFSGDQPSAETASGLTQLIQGAFHGLDQKTIDELRKIGKRKTYPSGSVLCKQGKIGDRFFVVLDGKIAVTQFSQNEEESMVGVIGKGKYFGELSLLDDHPNSATCTTMTEASVLELNKQQFQHMVKTYPLIANSLMMTILARMREDDARAIHTLLQKNEELGKAYSKLQTTQDELLEAERWKRELELAAEVQRDLLPKDLPQIQGYHFASYLGSTHATGNFYDVIPLNDEYVGILLGDVAGRGIQASMFMAVTRTLYVVESKRSLSPFDVTEAVHYGLQDVTNRDDMFVKTFYGVLHWPTGMFSYVIAGHAQPYLLQADGKIRQFHGRGSYLGQSASIHLEERRVRLKNGDRLVLFSDGVIDSENAAGEAFGHSQFQKVLQAQAALQAEELITHLQQEIWMWQAGSKTNTGFAMLVITID
ncbi:MAG: SpoIIE family protein phosphatase [Ardenticatenaceae bacterium]|nr:SpoIIE family protein phosphatase [Ardenticatenaceae bacterium]